MNVRPVTDPDDPRSRARGGRSRFTWLVGIATVLVGLVIVLGASPRAGSRPGEHRAASAVATSRSHARPELARGARNGSTPAPSLTPSGTPAPPIERLAQLEQTPEENALLWDAVQLRIAACMEQRGFHYDRLPYDESVDEDGDRMRFKPGNVEAAKQWGYGLARRMEDSERREAAAAQRPRRSMSPAYREALAGPPPRFGERPGEGWGTITTPQGAKLYWHRDSCLTHARDEVYGEDYAALELGMTISRLRKEVTAALASDDEYRAGLARWQACMAERGYSYSQPAEAMNALANDLHAGRLSLEDLRQKEIETAVADTACYLSTGLTEVLAAARERAERAVLARAAGTGEQLRSSLDNALARAETVLDGDAVR